MHTLKDKHVCVTIGNELAFLKSMSTTVSRTEKSFTSILCLHKFHTSFLAVSNTNMNNGDRYSTKSVDEEGRVGS
jgi:hypothetical protein